MTRIPRSLGIPLLCAASLVAAADAPSRFAPVPPEAEYFRRKDVMADLLMPNYKAAWSGFRGGDAKSTREAIGHLAAGARMIPKFSPPAIEGGSREDFLRRAGDLRERLEALETDFDATFADRSAFSSRILAIYQSCQGCHETYAPAEGADRRKYTPPS